VARFCRLPRFPHWSDRSDSRNGRRERASEYGARAEWGSTTCGGSYDAHRVSSLGAHALEYHSSRRALRLRAPTTSRGTARRGERQHRSRRNARGRPADTAARGSGGVMVSRGSGWLRLAGECIRRGGEAGPYSGAADPRASGDGAQHHDEKCARYGDLGARAARSIAVCARLGRDRAR
jgi:hypothetical protein